MNRFLRNVFFALALLLLLYALLFANFLHAMEASVWHAKVFWLAVIGAGGFFVAGWRFSLKNKFKVFLLLLGLLLVELVLQTAAWTGFLPAVNIARKAPYARVYWTAEGHGNAIRNRFGWHYPAFDLSAAHKVVFIGNSQVEGLEVLPNQNQAADLHALLRKKSPDWAVLGLGNHGSCPAHAIDVLEYAWQHFQPTEAVLVVSLGNDVSAASASLHHVSPDQYVYYDLDAGGNLVLNPASVLGRERFVRGLEVSHRSLLFNLPFTLYTHCMIFQVVDSLRENLQLRREQAVLTKAGHGELANGFNPTLFAVNPAPEAQRAQEILLAQLRQCQTVCARRGMKFHIVTLPAFPKVFYDTQRGTNWTMHIGDFDYLGPERRIAAWAQTNGIPIVPLGDVMRQKNLDVAEIRSLYFSNGTGHLTVKGHAFCAQAICELFYPTAKP